VRRIAGLAVVVAIVSSACGTTLGPTLPDCDTVGSTMVLAVESVPGSHYVSCIVGLRADWDYNNLTAKSWESSYTLDSDRIGMGFLEVHNVQSCDVGDAVRAEDPIPGVELWKDVDARTTVDIVIVPEGPTIATSVRTIELLSELEGEEIKGKAVVVSSSTENAPTASRIRAAADAGAHVIIVSVRDAEEGTLTVLVQGARDEVAVEDLDAALDLIGDVEAESTYTGNWYFVFEGGCVVYTFDAVGSGVATLEDDVRIGLSLFDAEELRQAARDAGYELP
jgi:hypothetical protein